jgi:hypothetical protein
VSNAVFPAIIGLDWGITLGERFDTLIYGSAAPGYEIRIPKGPDPTFNIKLRYEYLRNNAVNDELSTLRSFFRARKGSYDSFLLDTALLTENVLDTSIIGQVLVPDVNNYAPLIRSVAGTPETIYEIHTITNIKGNGTPIVEDVPNAVPASGKWARWDSSPSRVYGGKSYPGVVIQFGSTPAAPITSDFSWYYRVRFEKDNADFDAFMFELYELQEISMVTTRDL